MQQTVPGEPERLDLSVIEQMALAATEGPWMVRLVGERRYPQQVVTRDGQVVAELFDARGGGGTAPDAAFIAACRDAVPPLLAALASAHDLIRSFIDPGPCSFDHHGGCQAHGYLDLEPGEKCLQQQAKDFVGEGGESA